MAPVDLSKIEEKLDKPLAKTRALSIKEQLAYLTKSVDRVVTSADLEKKLTARRKNNKKLRIKYGIDPTVKDIHMGHAVPIRLLKKFQTLGHRIVLVIGDFTATVGDPSGRVKERPVLTEKQVKDNFKTYLKQAGLILDLKKTETHFNSEWLNKLSLGQFFSYLQLQTVAAGMEREDFRKRQSITRSELLYATLQAIDSIELKADVEVGGADQLLNFIEARELMSKVGMTPQSIITTPLLLGLSGQEKMSKSLKNYIGLLEPADQIFGKVMSIPDDHMQNYFDLLTDLEKKEWQEIKAALDEKAVHPMEVKKLLARQVTKFLHPDDNTVAKAQATFEKVFSDKQAPEEVPSVKVSKVAARDAASLLVEAKLAPSRSEAKRLLAQAAVSYLDEDRRTRLEQLTDNLKNTPLVLQVGKHRFVKIIWV